MKIEVKRLVEGDRAWVFELLRERWLSTMVVSRGRLHCADELPGLVAWTDGERVGYATYRIEHDECEIVTLDSLEERAGIGSTLVAAVEARAREAGCSRVWLVTTNDNRPAQAFYERTGFALVGVHEGAVRDARELKPEIPATGVDGEPIVDEVEYERMLPV